MFKETAEEKMREQRRKRIFGVLTNRHPEWKIKGYAYSENKEKQKEVV